MIRRAISMAAGAGLLVIFVGGVAAAVVAGVALSKLDGMTGG